MSFGARDLRPGKDVFDADGAYLGTVVWLVTRRPVHDATRSAHRASAGSTFSGEAIGPMPTGALGNSGPRSQSPSTAYATTPPRDRAGTDDARQPTELIVLRLLTSLNWSTLRPRVWRVPVGLVQAVSHERIVLAVRESALT